MTKKQNVIIDDVNIYELDHVKLLNLAQKLHNELNKERLTRLLIEEDRNQLNVAWEATKRRLVKVKSDVNTIRQAAEKNARQVEDIGKQFRRQRADHIIEKELFKNEIHMKNEENVKRIVKECQQQKNELFMVNCSLQEIIETRAVQQRHLNANTKIGITKLIMDKMSDLRSHMNVILGAAEERQKKTISEIKEMYEVDLETNKDLIKNNIQTLIDSYNEKFSSHKISTEGKFKRQYLVIDALQQKIHELQEIRVTLEYENQYYKKKCNKIHDFRKFKDEVIRLKNTIASYDTTNRLSETTKKEAEKYKTLYKRTIQENIMLKNLNEEVKEGFKKYERHFLDVLVNAERKFCLEKLSLEFQCSVNNPKIIKPNEHKNDIQYPVCNEIQNLNSPVIVTEIEE